MIIIEPRAPHWRYIIQSGMDDQTVFTNVIKQVSRGIPNESNTRNSISTFRIVCNNCCALERHELTAMQLSV